MSCSTPDKQNIKNLKTKNIVDYFNLLSEQKIVQGKISYINGNYTIKMDDCYEASYLKVNLINSSILYVFSNPCAGPPPVYTVIFEMTISNDNTAFFHIDSEERTFGDKTSDFYKYTGTEFEKVSIKVLPAEAAERFKH